MYEKSNTEIVAETIFQLIPKYEGMDEALKAEIEEELDDLDEEGGIECRRIKPGKAKPLRWKATIQMTQIWKKSCGVLSCLPTG